MLVNAPAATETVTYLHSDTLGNVIGESKADGSFTRYHYKPYGERVESAPERLGFTGHLHQKELGLTYMQARHFDPLMGRFYGNDPVGFTPDNVFSFNRYGYGNNNPYKYSDPDGEESIAIRVQERAIQDFGAGKISKSELLGVYKNQAVGAATGTAVVAAGVSPQLIRQAGAIYSAARQGENGEKGAENGANLPKNAPKLEKQLASEEQLGQLSSGGGTVISQPAKQAERIASETGLDAANIQKVSSDARVSSDGQKIETHSFRDAITNELIEPKTIIED